MTETLRREAARVAVIDMDRRLLLLHTWDPGGQGSDVWELPGGGLRDGEIPVDGARRELLRRDRHRAGEFGPRLGVVETDFEFDGRRYRAAGDDLLALGRAGRLRAGCTRTRG